MNGILFIDFNLVALDFLKFGNVKRLCRFFIQHLLLENDFCISQNVGKLKMLQIKLGLRRTFVFFKLRKRCHKFTHTFQLSRSCEQEDFSSSNKFLHLTGPITEQR